MGNPSARSITALLVPTFVLAALAGTVVGGLTGGLMLGMPYLFESDPDSMEGLEAWGGLGSYTLTGVLFGAVAGLIYGLVVAAASIASLAAQAGMRLRVTGERQALASALGSASAALLLAGIALAANTDATASSFAVASCFILVTFLVALLIGRTYLKRFEVRDPSIIPAAELLNERYGNL